MSLSHSTSSASNDILVWQRFIAGEEEAFDILMSSQFRTLFQYGTKFSKDKEFVKDSIQDLFLSLWERRSHLGHEVAVKPYLMASLRRLMHRKHDQKVRLGEDHLDGQEGEFALEFSVEETYIEQEAVLALTQKLKKIMDELPLRQKEAVYLKFYQELDRSQIAEVMQVSPQTVSNILQIAMKQFKKHWQAEMITFFMLHTLL